VVVGAAAEALPLEAEEEGQPAHHRCGRAPPLSFQTKSLGVSVFPPWQGREELARIWLTHSLCNPLVWRSTELLP